MCACMQICNPVLHTSQPAQTLSIHGMVHCSAGFGWEHFGSPAVYGTDVCARPHVVHTHRQGKTSEASSLGISLATWRELLQAAQQVRRLAQSAPPSRALHCQPHVLPLVARGCMQQACASCLMQDKEASESEVLHARARLDQLAGRDAAGQGAAAGAADVPAPAPMPPMDAPDLHGRRELEGQGALLDVFAMRAWPCRRPCVCAWRGCYGGAVPGIKLCAHAR